MSPVGTPDGQQGVAQPQVALATVTAGTATKTVGVPANAQTIIVIASSTPGLGTFTAVGGTTSFGYPVGFARNKVGSLDQAMYFVNVADCIDSTIVLTFSLAPSNNWFIYADQGVHVTFDPFVGSIVQAAGSAPDLNGVMVEGSDGNLAHVLTTDTRGTLEAVSVPPGSSTGDHPTNEMQYITSGFAGVFDLLGPPASGKRYRIFDCSMTPYAAPVAGNLATMYDNFSGRIFATCGPLSSSHSSYLPSGITMTGNGKVSGNTPGGNFAVSLAYTIETV